MEHLVHGKFASKNVGCDARDVADLALDLEPSALGFGRPPLDLVQIAVDEIDSLAVDLQPGASVDDATPVAGFENTTGPSD